MISRSSVFGGFLLILFSSVHAAGIAFSFQDPVGLAFTLFYVALLVWTLILFERRASFAREEGTSGAVVFLRPARSLPLPLHTAAQTLILLVGLGFGLGTALYLVVPPREAFDPDPLPENQSGSSEYADEGVEGQTQLPAGTLESPLSAFTGPGKGVPLGSVATIKKDITPWFQVELEGSDAAPPLVILRDNVMDHCRQDGLWTDTLSEAGRVHRYRDRGDGKRDGWVQLGHEDRAGDGHTLRITILRGGQKRLYLQPDAVRMKLMRGKLSRSAYVVTESANETLQVDFPIKGGDVLLQRYVPQVRAGTRLEGRRSDHTVNLFDSYLQVPEESADALLKIAQEVVGGETDPWRRADLLETWLNGEEFEYTLSAPALNRKDPVVDFLVRTRSGSCSYYATALTLLLRTLGHPSRYVRGFWGGDKLYGSPVFMLRGLHYHAWTELYLDGVGWVPLNPTPPDRAPADVGTNTAAAGGRAQEDGSFSFLFYDHAQWRHLWTSTGTWIATYLLHPLGVLFGGQAGYAGYPFLLVLLMLLRQRRARREIRALARAGGQALPKGPYGQALLLLAGKGLHRRPTWTAREFRRFVILRYPTTSRALAALTRLYELERFGGGASPRARTLGERALAELRGLLSSSSDPTVAPLH